MLEIATFTDSAANTPPRSRVEFTEYSVVSGSAADVVQLTSETSDALVDTQRYWPKGGETKERKRKAKK